MAGYQHPPTYAEFTLKDPVTGNVSFNPVWLRWFMDIASFSAAVPESRRRYKSAQVAVPTADIDTTSAHGLGAVPTGAVVSLVCTTAEYGYAVGDEIQFTGFYDGDVEQPLVVWANATVVGWRSYSATPYVKRRDADGVVAITNAKWELIFRAWL